MLDPSILLDVKKRAESPFGVRPENPELLRQLVDEIERLYREVERLRRSIE